MSKVRRLSSKTIDEFTKLGYNELQSGNLNTAVEAFKNAHRHSLYLNDGNTEQLCAFNLGAAYVAAKKPREGLQLLAAAVPPCKKPNEKPKGDVYYNFGLGYETMQNVDEMIKYFELALEEYQKEDRSVDTLKKIINVARKLGFSYCKLGSHSQAIARLKVVANLHEKLESDVNERIPIFLELALQLCVQEKFLEALHFTDECFTCCSKVEDGSEKGEIYHDLGLIYVRCKEYHKGCCCFEFALPLIRAADPGGKKEATMIQNLGACYNALGDYQRAVAFHEEALQTYSLQYDKSGQAQCYNNLAFAFISLGDFEGAEEAHKLALTTSIETGDSHNQWQSLEGLGTVAFNKGNIDGAIGHFRASVNILATSEENYPAHHRLLTKFRDSVNYKDLYAVRAVPPPPVINASMSLNFSESYHRTGKYLNGEQDDKQEISQNLEQSKTRTNLFESLQEDSENDSVFSEASSDSFETDELYQTDTMLRRYREQQISKNLSLEGEETKGTSGLRRTKSENLANITRGKNAVQDVNKLLMSSLKSGRNRPSKEYISKSQRSRVHLLHSSMDLGIPPSSSESEDNYYQREDEAEPEHADRLSESQRARLVTLAIPEKKALTKSSKQRNFKLVPKKATGKPSKSKSLMTKKERELQSQIENDGFLRAFKEIEIAQSDKSGTGKRKRVKEKMRGSKKGKQKIVAKSAGDSGVFEETIAVEGAAEQNSALHIDLSEDSNATSEVEEEVIATSATGVQSAPNTDAIESGTIAGSSLAQLRVKNESTVRKLPQRKNNKDVCGTSTDVIDSSKPMVTMKASADDIEGSDPSTAKYLDKGVQTPRRKKSILCTIM